MHLGNLWSLSLRVTEGPKYQIQGMQGFNVGNLNLVQGGYLMFGAFLSKALITPSFAFLVVT